MAPRVVIFSPGHHEIGGAPKRSRLLASGLARRGWRVRVLGRADSRRGLRLDRSTNLTVLDVGGFGLSRAGTILYLLLAVPLGVVWGLGSSAFLAVQLVSPSVAGALAAGLLRRSYVAMATTSGASSEVTCLTDDDPEPRGAWSKRAYRLDRRLRRRLLNRAAFLVAQSEAAADELSRVVPRERIVVIPTPVELLVPPPLTGAPRAVFTGRLSRDKDLLRLLDAWHDVAGRHPGSLLTLVGDGGPHQSVEPALRQRVAQDAELTATVRFTGWVADVSPFLADSDVFVFPSLSEGMSNSLLEACAWGRVVVASDIPANREALGDDYPLLFPAGDAAALARALLRSFDDADARRAARTRVTARAEELSLDRAVERLEPLLRASQHRARVS